MTESVYANVIVDIQARELKDKLFTYKVPPELTDETFIGAQVLVPFGGRNLVGGYVVSLSNEAKSDFTIKEIAEVVESESFFDKDYVQFLYWIADYYCANLSDVISAAIPSVLSPKYKRIVRLNETAISQRQGSLSTYETTLQVIIRTLQSSKNNSLSVVTLKQRARKEGKLNSAQFYRATGLLRQEGIITISDESSKSQAPRTVSTAVWNGQEGETPRQKEVLSIIFRRGGQMPVKELVEAAKTTAATLKKMAGSGLLTLIDTEVIRDPLDRLTELTTQNAPILTEAQASVMETLTDQLLRVLDDREKDASQTPQPWLLYGVTGSGKTEIYLRLIDLCLRKQRGCMLLVPEISLTPQLARRLKSRFGDLVCVWHSGLSAGEKYDTWRRLRLGEAKVLLGARSAILANLPDLGLIILDEEHDSSYKQTSPSPRYNAKDVALEKARRLGALVLLGSATPDVAIFAQALENNRILSLPTRVFKQNMPDVAVVDMREEFSRGNKGIFSRALGAALKECLDRKEQAILLINRRGYASHVFCRACGYVIKCKNCSVALVFHQRTNARGERTYAAGYLACHHCGFRSRAIEICPSCQSPFIKQYGLGTQRVEEEVRELFPESKILRLDSDVTVRKGSHDEILQGFARGDADVLIGTQMVSKGLDIANVTLVGVMTADAAFNLPDYRSTERGFQLLTQVAGRAGRGDRPGQVIMQTYDCEMPALRYAQHHDYANFYAEEIEARRDFEYPPFSQIIRIVVAGSDAPGVEFACHRLAEEINLYIHERLPPESVKVLGPAPCLIERLRGNFRYHLILKNLGGEACRKQLCEFLRVKYLSNGLQMAVDVDALDLV